MFILTSRSSFYSHYDTTHVSRPQTSFPKLSFFLNYLKVIFVLAPLFLYQNPDLLPAHISHSQTPLLPINKLSKDPRESPKRKMVSPSCPPSSSSSSRINRHGRSMRTIRPSALTAARADVLCDTSRVSEFLTDSVVDVQLTQLAAAISGPKSTSFDQTDLSLELSDEFSGEFSGKFSDISGELHRLAFVSNTHIPKGEIFDNNSLLSLDFIENVTVKIVEPLVKSCVHILLSSDESDTEKSNCAGNIRLLAKHRPDFRELIGSLGAVETLIPYLKSTDPCIQENAVTALLNLSLEELNKILITSHGGIKPLIYVLKTGTNTSKQNAACALLSLAMVEDNRSTIGVLGAIPHLVSLLVNGTTRGKKDALTTLYKLCSVKQNKERAIGAGAVSVLIDMIGEHGNGIMENALVVISSLASIKEGVDAVVEEGGMQVLVEAIEDRPSKGKEFAVVTLLQLCQDSIQNRGFLIREGAIPPLVALSQNGSTKAKHKAETLLGYLRELRHDVVSSGMGR